MISIAALLASWFAATGLVWKLFERAEKATTTEAKQALYSWIQGLNPENALQRIAESFTNAFDAVFGESHWSWACFGRSSLASITAVCALTMLWFAIDTAEAARFHSEPLLLAAVLLIWIVVLNLIPDYLSLLKSRWIIGRLSRGIPLRRAILWLTADLLATTALASIWWGLFFVAIAVAGHFIEGENSVNAESVSVLVLNQILPLKSSPNGGPSPGIPFYSTFLTSVWVCLHTMSAAMLRLSPFLARGSDFVKRYFVREDQPFVSLGAVSVFLVTVGYVVMGPFLVAF